MRPVATGMSRNPTARANCWRKFGTTYPNKSRSSAAAHMSAIGTQRTSLYAHTMSGFGDKADIGAYPQDVRSLPCSDMRFPELLLRKLPISLISKACCNDG